MPARRYPIKRAIHNYVTTITRPKDGGASYNMIQYNRILLLDMFAANISWYSFISCPPRRSEFRDKLPLMAFIFACRLSIARF